MKTNATAGISPSSSSWISPGLDVTILRNISTATAEPRLNKLSRTISNASKKMNRNKHQYIFPIFLPNVSTYQKAKSGKQILHIFAKGEMLSVKNNNILGRIKLHK